MFDLGIVFVSAEYVYAKGPHGWLFRAWWGKFYDGMLCWVAWQDPLLHPSQWKVLDIIKDRYL